MKQTRPPKNLPEKGDYVRLRGDLETRGYLVSYNPENEWARVSWKSGKGPVLCHRYELMKLETTDRTHGIQNPKAEDC